jgi:hypothetical protein
MDCHTEVWDAVRADAIIDIVGVLLLVPVLDGIALHGEKRRDRGDRDLDPSMATIW